MSVSEGSTIKSESIFREAQLQLASRKRETHWNDYGNPGLKNQSKYKDLSYWTQEIRTHQFSLSHPRSFPSLFFDDLSWQLSSLRLLHRVREFKLPVLGFYIPKGKPSKERSLEILEFKCVLWMTHLRSPVQAQISHPGRVMGSYDWLYMITGPDPAAHMILFPPELHDWSWGETAPRIVNGGWSRPWKSLWWPPNSTTSSFRGILRGNEIDSLHPISDDLITGLLLQGSLGEVVHADLVPSCSHSPVTSSLPHMPALSFPVLFGKWWPQWIPEPSPSPRAQNAPSLASNAAGENAMQVSGDPGYT